jgi:hypothetical protein
MSGFYGFSHKPFRQKTYRKRRMKAVPSSAAGRGPFEVTEASPDQSPYSQYPLYNSNATKVGKFSAPGGNDPVSKAMRAHEYGHLILGRKGVIPKTPRTIHRHNKELDALNIQFLGDSYVNTFLRRKRVDEVNDLPVTLENMDREQLEELPPHIIAGEYIRHLDMPALQKQHYADQRIRSARANMQDLKRATAFQKSLPGYKHQLDQCEQKLKRAEEDRRKLSRHPSVRARDIASQYLTQDQVNWIERFYYEEILGTRKRYGPSFAHMTARWQEQFGPWPPGEAPWELQEKEMQLSPEEREMFEQYSQYYPSGVTPPPVEDPGVWGEMGIVENTDRPRRIREALKALQPKPGFIGAFKFPHRADLRFGDGRAFAHKKRELGGTILLDCSGSMSLSAEEINDLMEGAPAGKIACYAETGYLTPAMQQEAEQSNSYWDRHSESGILIVAAEKGRAMHHYPLREALGCNNLVDGMALRWLAQQKGPRIWVSDGGVTGIYGHGDKLKQDAFNVVRRGRIKHVATIGDCISLVKRLSGRN